MRRALFTALCALAVTLSFHPANAIADPAWRSWDAGLREAEASGRPLLVAVYTRTDKGGWCRRMDRDVYARADVQDYLARKFVAVKLDAGSNDSVRYEGRAYTSRTLVARLDVTGYPATRFLSAKGVPLWGVMGYFQPQDFLLLLRFIGDGHAERGEKYEDFMRAAKASEAPPRR
jgi:thioredoxin-related protein